MRPGGHAWIAALALLARASAAAPAPPLVPEWLEKDRALAESWKPPVDPGELSPRAVLENLHVVPSPVDTAKDLGYGLQLVHGRRPGGYCSGRASLLAHGGRVAQMRIALECSEKAWPALAARIADTWGAHGQELGTTSFRGREVVWTHDARMAAVRRVVSEDLGAPDPAEVPAKLAGAVEELTSPFRGTDVSFTGGCYFGGTDPSGKKAMDALVKAKRWDLVRAVARGLNPEGRVYAAHALASLPADRRTPADRAVIGRIRALPVAIRVCQGCKVTTRPADQLLSTP